MDQTPIIYRDRPKSAMDPLSELLSILHSERAVFAGLKAGGDWSIDFPPPDGVKFNAIIEGQCWLKVDGMAAISLKAGNCFLLSQQLNFSLCTDLQLPAPPADQIYAHADDAIAEWGRGIGFFLIGGRFAFADGANLLFASLPAVMVIRKDSQQAAVLNWALAQLADELQHHAVGQSIMVQHLGQIMLVQVLRIYQAQQPTLYPSWLQAIADPRLGAVMQAIHQQPARSWTVAALAQIAGLSRSSFALRFKQQAGMPPLAYVARWRIQLALRLLKTNRCNISAIAQQLGYDSDSAFSHAFKRIMHCSPRDYRAQYRAQYQA